ncbi:MAG: HAMP domain-containing histidine kinase [Lawsonibacter sp.]|nr:HAMP domain-containing histidine kinase [Lawsonibacter sp.]
MLPWLICGALALAALVLLARLLLLRRSLDEMVRQLEERLSQDTNSPIFLSTRDPHARKLAAELNVHLKDLRRQRQKFQQGDAELKAAVANISHDLRTPLTAMQGYLDLLEREELSPGARRYLDSIQNRMAAMTRLTEELFRYSLAAGRQELLPEEVDLRRCLEESLVSFYAAMGRRGIAPDISLPQGPVVRTLDPSAVGRIFGNIISNALKYSDGDFSASLDESGTAVFSNAARALDPVSAARLFDRFYTVETGRGSTGLGLSIARQLTERMGGTIRADYEQARLYITVHFPKT